MLDQLPREVLLNLLAEHLPPEDCFYLRFCCRALSALASRAFEIHIRRMLQEPDPELIIIFDTIRNKGQERVGFDKCMSAQFNVGRLLNACGGTLKLTMVCKYIEKHFRNGDPNFRRDVERCSQYASFLRGLLPSPSVNDLRCLITSFSISLSYLDVPWNNADFWANTKFDKEIGVQAVLSCKRVTLPERFGLLAMLEGWPRDKVEKSNVDHIFKLVNVYADKSNGLGVLCHFAHVAIRLWESERDRCIAGLLQMETWEKRGRLVFYMLRQVYGFERISGILHTAFLESPEASVAGAPRAETLDDRKSFLRGIVQESESSNTHSSSQTCKSQILQTLLCPAFWGDDLELQAIDCIPPEFLTPNTLLDALRKIRDRDVYYAANMVPDIQRLAALVSRLPDNPGTLLSETFALLENPDELSATFYELLQRVEIPCLADFLYHMSLMGAGFSFHGTLAGSRFCHVVVSILDGRETIAPTSNRLKAISKIIYGWIDPRFSSKASTPGIVRELIESLHSALVDKVPSFDHRSHLRLLGVLLGAASQDSQAFGLQSLSQVFGLNNDDLAGKLFKSYGDIGELVFGHFLASGKFPDVAFEDVVGGDWTFTAPGHLTTIDPNEVLEDGRRKSRMLSTASKRLDQIKVALVEKEAAEEEETMDGEALVEVEGAERVGS